MPYRLNAESADDGCLSAWSRSIVFYIILKNAFPDCKRLKNQAKEGIFSLPVSRLTERRRGNAYHTTFRSIRCRTISKEPSFDDCIILSKEAFDPDAVFLDDIVDDEVLPYLSLAVDGLTTSAEGKKGKLDLRPEDVATNAIIEADTTMPVASLSSEHLDVDDWNVSLWGRIRKYFGF